MSEVASTPAAPAAPAATSQASETSAAQSTVSVVASAALTTAEQLLPVIIAALEAGAGAGAPQAVLIAQVAAVIPPLIQSFGANSDQIQSLMGALVTQIQASQKTIDAAAASRGIPVQP